MSNMSNGNTSRANGETSELKAKALITEKQLEKLAQDTGERLGEITSDIVNSTSQRFQMGRDYVSENPVKGVVMAATAGLVVGGIATWVMRRRSNE